MATSDMVSDAKTNETTPDALTCWEEWRRICALTPCSAATRDTLYRYAAKRFANLLRRYTPVYNPELRGARAPDAREAWHLFESRLTIHDAAGGKCYKNWLFARHKRSTASPLDTVESGAYLIMRDAVRQYLVTECQRHGAREFNDALAVPGDESPDTLLAPAGLSPATDAARNEYEALAAKTAAAFAATVRPLERLVLLAKALDLPLDNRVLLQTAGRSKTALHKIHRRVVERLVETVKQDYADEEADAVLFLALQTLEITKKNIFEQERVEMRFRELFRLVEAT